MSDIDLRTERQVDPYTEVAKRLFNEFLEMLLALRQQGAVLPEQQDKERAKYEKELKKWRDANNELKTVAKQLTEENEKLSAEIDRLELERDNLRLKLNQTIINQQAVARQIDHAVSEYPLDQHMTDRSFKEWQKIMQSLPSLRGDDNDA